jgi:hypothetical protein
MTAIRNITGYTKTAPPFGRAVRAAVITVGALLWVFLFLVLAPQMGTFGADSIAYAMASPPLYDAPGGTFGAFTYSPAFYQVVAPFQPLGWVAFATLWTALLVGTVIWLGPLSLPLAALEVYLGNVHLLIAAAIVIGFRYPAAWAFVLLTKPTCGIGLLWFAARGEWRNLAWALGATAAIVAVSFALGPGLLVGYVGSAPEVGLSLAVPLAVRLPVAAVVVVWGARTDRRWTVPVAVFLALPVVWVHSIAILAAIPLARTARPRTA